MELVIAIAIFGVGLVVISMHNPIGRAASGMLRFTPVWIKRVIFGDHVMKVAVGFFAIMLVVLTKIFGP